MLVTITEEQDTNTRGITSRRNVSPLYQIYTSFFSLQLNI